MIEALRLSAFEPVRARSLTLAGSARSPWLVMWLARLRSLGVAFMGTCHVG